MYLKFRTNAPIPYMEYVLTKLALDVQLFHNETYDCYSTWIEDQSIEVDEAVSCWLQLKLRDSGYSTEGVKVFDFDTCLPDFSLVAEAENYLLQVLET